MWCVWDGEVYVCTFYSGPLVWTLRERRSRNTSWNSSFQKFYSAYRRLWTLTNCLKAWKWKTQAVIWCSYPVFEFQCSNMWGSDLVNVLKYTQNNKNMHSRRFLLSVCLMTCLLGCLLLLLLPNTKSRRRKLITLSDTLGQINCLLVTLAAAILNRKLLTFWGICCFIVFFIWRFLHICFTSASALTSVRFLTSLAQKPEAV